MATVPQLGKRHMVTFATDRPEVRRAHIAGLLKLLPFWRWSANPYQEPAGAKRCSETYAVRMPAELILAAPPGAGAGRRYAPPS